MTKTIGIIGGMSPESTALYYQIIIRKYIKKFSDFYFPEIIIYSVKHQKLMDWRSEGRHDLIINEFCNICNKLENAGADFVIIATNTMHYFLPEIRNRISIPILSIIDSTGDAINKENIKKIGLLGTKFTMSSSFYKDELYKKGIDTFVPGEIDQIYINKTIFGEIEKNILLDNTKSEYLRIINDLKNNGAEGIILGCTEIPLLIKQSDTSIKLFDTLSIHAEAALDFALN